MNNSLIRRHSSVASLRAKAQQHMSNLGIGGDEGGEDSQIDIEIDTEELDHGGKMKMHKIP